MFLTAWICDIGFYLSQKRFSVLKNDLRLSQLCSPQQFVVASFAVEKMASNYTAKLGVTF
jgi:hypothetical protein